MQKTPDFMPDFKANLPRTSHVLSHDFSFTATTAHLNPVFHTIVSPGDTIKLGFNFNLRTMPLEAAAFGDLVCHTEYFFVPMQLLFQPFDSVYYGVNDQFSSRFAQTPSNVRLPLVDFVGNIDGLMAAHDNAALYYPDTTIPVESIGQSSMRLLDLLGFNPVGVACRDSGSGQEYFNPNVFPYQLLAYNCIYQYYYRLDSRERFDQNSFNFDTFYNRTSTVSPSEWNFVDYCLMHYRPLDNDYFTDVKVSPVVDVLNLTNKYSLDAAHNWLTRRVANGGFSVLSSGSVGSDVSETNGSVSPMSLNNPSSDIQTNFGFGELNVDRGFNPDDDNLFYPINGLDINTANIRAMFANEKLWSITGRAKKNYDDQTLAHFGFKVPHDVKHEISCFGHDTSMIHIGEVISTAGTTNVPLGEIAGKGYGSQNVGTHSFTAPCHGVVMCIFSVVSRRNYEAGILKANAVASREDLFIPEYDHLGMQPLFGYETYYPVNVSEDLVKSSTILGWQYRYEQWKRRYNRTSGAFKNATGSLKGWVPTYQPYNGDPRYFDTGKVDNLPNQNSFTQFINLPTDVNQLFLAQYPSEWSEAYESLDGWSGIYDNDPFVINSNIDCVLVSSMSDYSLPRLDA